jgi:hypothetical protein
MGRGAHLGEGGAGGLTSGVEVRGRRAGHTGDQGDACEDADLRAWEGVVSCLQCLLCMMIQRKTEGGFTVRDVLTVLGLLGVAALAIPATRSEASAPAPASDGSFADQVARELQRTRGEAVTTRVPRYAFIYSNRVEIRAAKRGAGRGAWVAPTTSDPVLRTVRARLGVSAVDVTSRAGLPSFTLTETSAKEIVFGSGGTGALASIRSARPTALHLYITNDTVGNNHPERTARVDIAATSGVVSLGRSW